MSDGKAARKDAAANAKDAKGGPAAGDGHTHEVTKRLPVTVISGFLGSGKTTLLSYILHNKQHGLKVAVINNEFAQSLDIGTKHELSAKATDAATVAADIYDTGAGCLCCGGGRSDFVRIMHELIHHRDKIDYVLLETTGMADPSFANVFALDPAIKQHFVLDGFVTLVDARHCIDAIDKPATFAVAPDGTPIIATPDAADLDVSKSKPLSAVAKQADGKDGVFPAGAEQIVNETVTQLAIADRVIINKCDLVTSEQVDALERRIHAINPLAQTLRTTYSQVGDLKQILDIKAFTVEKALRADAGFMDFRPFRRHDPRVQPLCFIVAPPKGAHAKAAAKPEVPAAHEKPQTAVLSVAGAVPRAAFEKWIRAYLTAHKADVLRFKAVLSVAGSNAKCMVQGVRDLVDFADRQDWEEGEPRVSRLVFIGRNLSEKDVQQTFADAMRSPALPDSEQLRLRVYGGGGDSESFAVRLFTLLVIVLVVLYNWLGAGTAAPATGAGAVGDTVAAAVSGATAK